MIFIPFATNKSTTPSRPLSRLHLIYTLPFLLQRSSVTVTYCTASPHIPHPTASHILQPLLTYHIQWHHILYSHSSHSTSNGITYCTATPHIPHPMTSHIVQPLLTFHIQWHRILYSHSSHSTSSGSFPLFTSYRK
jgi:hypothetical protein